MSTLSVPSSVFLSPSASASFCRPCLFLRLSLYLHLPQHHYVGPVCSFFCLSISLNIITSALSVPSSVCPSPSTSLRRPCLFLRLSLHLRQHHYFGPVCSFFCLSISLNTIMAALSVPSSVSPSASASLWWPCLFLRLSVTLSGLAVLSP